MGETNASAVHELQPTVDQYDFASDTAAQTEPPTDGGRNAWLVLASSFILGMIVWGFPWSFGVFQEYYLRQEQFSGSHSGVAAVGTTATGIMYILAPFLYVLFQQYHAYRKMIAVSGFIVMLASLIGASFANTVSQLLVTQGILYGLGGAFLYFPVFNYIDEWFIKRRGLAYGGLIAGDGIGGVVIPFVMEWMLNRFGFRTALRIWTFVSLLFVIPALMLLKDYPVHQGKGGVNSKVDLRFLKAKAFWVLVSGNIIPSLGYFMPSLYLPSFAVACGFSAFSGTVALSLMNVSIVVGALIIGALTDRYHVTVTLNICTIGTVASVFLLWSFAVYQPIMYAFAIMYGFFAGAFPATWSGCSHPVRRVYPVETGMIIALFTAAKGVSSLIAGPFSGYLVEIDVWEGHAGYAYGSGYGNLIVLCGVTAAFGSLGWIGKKMGLVL